jgi:anaerobic magnesium-protoporphyrin IX monomethyl ester cyclase
MPIKILFIDAKDTSKSIETQLSSLGLGYLVSSVRQKFGPDAAEFRIVSKDVEKELDSFMPNMVGISAVSQNYGRAIAYASTAQKRGIPVICGGIHISMLPNSLDESMLLGVLGEGEETFCELFDLFRKTGGFAEEELEHVRGIIYRSKVGRLLITEPRPQVRPLDNIPFPARDLLEVRTDTHIFTTRGCPFRCVFCASSRFWNTVRLFSAEYVAAEIEHLVTQYGVTRINFFDDLFTCDVGRIRRLKELLRQRGLLGKVRFGGAIRAELVNEETMALLKELGVEGVGLGLESGNDRTLKYLKGSGASVTQNEKAVATVKKHGIKVFGSFVIGSPSEEKEEILDTLQFIKRTGVDAFAVYVLTPFPGTPVWDYAKHRNLVSDNMDWRVLNVNFDDNFASAIILSEKLGRADIRALYARFKRYDARRQFYNLVKKALVEPWKIPGYFMNKARVGLAARRHLAEKN